MKRRLFEILFLMGLFFAGHTLACEQVSPCTSQSCAERVSIDNHDVNVFRNYSLGVTACNVNQAVVVIHGSSRNADDYFTRMISAASAAGELYNTLVLAPNFVTQDDGISTGDLYWSSSGWKQGNTSNNDTAHISSFEVVDRLVQFVKDLYPGIDITIIGHSAGGQFVNRYAAGGAHADPHFVVANPSSYMYLSAHRPISGTLGTLFAIFNGDGCSGFNDYKYGLLDRNAYMRALSAIELIDNYTHRRVTYLLGSEDNQRDSNLGTSCSDDLQGYNRLERGQAFFNYMNTFAPGSPQDLVLVDGVGHSSTGMFNSPEGIETVFGGIDPAPTPDPNTSPFAEITPVSDDGDLLQVDSSGNITMVDEGDGDEDLAFSAVGSIDPDGDVLTYSWNIGGSNSMAGTTGQYTFNVGMTYAISLTVTDERGASDVKSITLRVVAGQESATEPRGKKRKRLALDY